MPWDKVEPVVDPSVRSLCFRPYPNHKNGCPNFNKKDGCPPSAPMIYNTLDFGHDIWVVWNVYDFKGHVEKMRIKHPSWSKRQLENCLYWQHTARKYLFEEVGKFLRFYDDTCDPARYLSDGLEVVFCPEAQGVNLTETMKKIKIVLEWPPVNVTYQIALVGKRK